MNVVAVLSELSPSLERYFHLMGWQVARNQMPELDQAPVMVRESFQPQQIEDCLQAPWVGGVEICEARQKPLGDCLLRHLAEGGIALVLRSDTAYGNEIANLFTDALSHRLIAADSDTTELEFVLHEMISNALLHGNFEIPSGMACDAEGLELFGEQVEQALESDMAARRVQISALLMDDMLEIAVEDEGMGYDRLTIPVDQVRPHGLELVSAMAADIRIEEKGRRAIARFPFRPRQRPKITVSMSGATVLVVDDKSLNRELLAALLTAIGVGRILQAGDGLQGLEMVRKEKPDLILLDVMMPKMDGHEMCRQLRHHYSLSELPVIFITALDGPADRFACFAAGGTDVVSKPFNNAEVIARVGVHLQLGLIMDKLKGFQERVHDELQRARSAQMALAPTPVQIEQVSQRTGLQIEGLMKTSSELGGDFWTILNAGPNQLCVLMADFTGHGTTAAFNVFRLHLLLSRLPRQLPAPAALLEHLNDELRRVFKPGEFASIFIGLIDLEQQSLTFSGAAVPPPVLTEDGSVRLLECEGPPLGAFSNPEFEEETVPFRPGSQLLIYSDALVESVAGDDLACREETLLEWAAEEDRKGQTGMAAAILERFNAILPGDPPDDLTLVSLRWPN